MAVLEGFWLAPVSFRILPPQPNFPSRNDGVGGLRLHYFYRWFQEGFNFLTATSAENAEHSPRAFLSIDLVSTAQKTTGRDYGVTCITIDPQSAKISRGALGMYSTANQIEPSASATAAE